VIAASRRINFGVDWTKLKGEYRPRTRTKKSIKYNKISWIFEHGLELEKKQKNGRWSGRYWLCKYCYDMGKMEGSLRPVSSTTSCSLHLKSMMSGHGILPNGATTEPQQGSVEEFLEEHHPLFAERFVNSFINLIAACDLSFEQAAAPELKQVILNGGIRVKHLLPCRNTVRNWLLSTFKERKPEVKLALERAKSRINLSFDIWSSPNDLSLLGVVAHFIDEKRQFRTALLALRRLFGHHGKADLAPLLKAIIDDYQLHGKLGAFQMDNASNNDTCLEALALELPELNVADSRLRCLGHVINLVVKALLFGNYNSALQKELKDASDRDQFTIWRKTGSIGKLHNLVRYIARSEQRISTFANAQREEAEEMMELALSDAATLKLVKDTGIRWNSTLSMISRALKLKLAIERYCRQWQQPHNDAYNLKQDFLDAQDWEELYHFEELLQPFEYATKKAEGNAYSGSNGALWEVLPMMDYLFKKLKKHADEVSESPQLFTDHYRHCINHGFNKLQEYYTKADDSRLYAAAVALHPCYRYNYFDSQWTPTTDGRRAVATAKRQTRELFEEYLERKHAADPPSPRPVPVPEVITPPPQRDDPDWYDTFTDYSKLTASSGLLANERRQHEQELERFLTAELDVHYKTIENGQPVQKSYIMEPLRWWRERGEELYPTLAEMAYDLFAIPAMSSECERAFSAAKRMITDERYRLKEDIIEADQCLKSWIKNKLANGTAAFESISLLPEPQQVAEGALIDVG